MGMFTQRTRFLKRFSNVTLTQAGTTIIGTLAGLRGALGLFIKVWGGNQAITVAVPVMKVMFDGATVATTAAAATTLTSINGTAGLGTPNGTEANPSAYWTMGPLNNVDGTGALASMGAEMGLLFPCYQLSLTCGAGTNATGVTVDVWVIDADANASANDTYMNP